MRRRNPRAHGSNARRHVAARNAGRSRVGHQVALLVVVDGTEASTRVLEYVGRILTRRDQVDVHLAYIASRVPAALLESGGSELPEREEQLEADLRSEQRRWIAAVDTTPDRILRAAHAVLQRAGVTAARIHSCVSSPLDIRTVADEVLLLAPIDNAVLSSSAIRHIRGFADLAEDIWRSNSYEVRTGSLCGSSIEKQQPGGRRVIIPIIPEASAGE